MLWFIINVNISMHIWESMMILDKCMYCTRVVKGEYNEFALLP